MQKYIKNGKGQSSYKPDLLIRGKGVGWNEASHWYRQSGDDGGRIPLIAKFRPSGWTKSYEYELTFNDRTHGSQYMPDISFRINRIDDKNQVLSSKDVIGLTTDVNNRVCPFCSNPVILDDTSNMWKCTMHQCQFSYTSDTCRLMYKDFKNENGLKGERRFSKFEALNQLAETKSDMAIQVTKYKL